MKTKEEYTRADWWWDTGLAVLLVLGLMTFSP